MAHLHPTLLLLLAEQAAIDPFSQISSFPHFSSFRRSRCYLPQSASLTLAWSTQRILKGAVLLRDIDRIKEGRKTKGENQLSLLQEVRKYCGRIRGDKPGHTDVSKEGVRGRHNKGGEGKAKQCKREKRRKEAESAASTTTPLRSLF
jgi:hypothetical protein